MGVKENSQMAMKCINENIILEECMLPYLPPYVDISGSMMWGGSDFINSVKEALEKMKVSFDFLNTIFNDFMEESKHLEFNKQRLNRLCYETINTPKELKQRKH